MNKAALAKLIVRRNHAKSQYDEATQEQKDAKKILEDIEHEILGELNESGLDMVRVDGVTVTVTNQDIYSVTDWDAMYEYILKNKATYLLQRRLMQKGIEELVIGGHDLPVDKFTKHKVSIRKI